MRAARALGLAAGMCADATFADPRRAHPVAAFGRWAGAVERRVWRDSVPAGAAFALGTVVIPIALGLAAGRAVAGRPCWEAVSTAAGTWAVLGGTSLCQEGVLMAGLLQAGDLPGARARLPNLCAREPSGLGAPELARATVESLAENTSDAVVAPLLWGAVAGIPGMLGYRAVNTLDAMIGYRSARYERFGKAAARLDDLANLVPARATGLLTAALAPAVGGSTRRTLRTLAADRRAHPSPNAGWCEAAAAGALGIRLGGTNDYGGRVEHRPVLGADGRAPEIRDIARAVRLSRTVGLAAAALAAAASLRRSAALGPSQAS